MTKMKKKIKEMTPEELRIYRHNNYLKHKIKRLASMKEYYQKNKDKIKEKANKRYRKKCGL